MSNETWKLIEGYSGRYEVSTEGRVRSFAQSSKGRILGGALRKQYVTVVLRRKGQAVRHYVHTLVLEAFVGPRPKGMLCCHANDVSGDNRLVNLRWDTRESNIIDAAINLLQRLGFVCIPPVGSGHSVTKQQV